MSEITPKIRRLQAHAFGIARDIADGFAARRGEGGQTATYRQLVNMLLSEPEVVTAIVDWRQAAIDALRSAEMPLAVPGRCRDLAERLRNFTPESQMGGSWTTGMAVDLLEQIANAWNRRPAYGTILSRETPRSVRATPVLLETTAMWAGAQTAQSDGAVHFSAEAWAKFVKCLGQDPALEILTSPGVSAPANAVHERCAARGCQEGLTCPQGKCALGPGEPR